MEILSFPNNQPIKTRKNIINIIKDVLVYKPDYDRVNISIY